MDVLEAKKQFEEKYYAEMPHVVHDLACLRDAGITMVRTGEHRDEREEGMSYLRDSVSGLEGARGRFNREYFASLYMLSRANFLLGHTGAAIEDARTAMAVVPSLPIEFEGQLVADQYVAIASGRLALILSAVDRDGPGGRRYAEPYIALAHDAARLARQTCRFSEDPERMLFADRSMSEDVRSRARRRHKITAVAATAGLWLPGAENRAKLAQRFCR